MTGSRPVVLVVGAASRDVTTDDPRGWRLGGAVAYASLALARMGFEVRALIGADAEVAEADEFELVRSADVAIAICQLASGPVFDNVRHILHATSDRIPLTALPRRWTSGFGGLLVVPVAAEVGDDWAAIAHGEPAPIVGLGWQGLLRHLAAGDLVRPAPPRSSPLVRAARLVVASREDVVPGSRPEDLVGLLGSGATLIWTEGAAGGLVLGGDGQEGRAAARRYPAIPSERVVDPTGAGDVFLAAMFAALIEPRLLDGIDAATTFAAAAASLTVEAPGLTGVPDLDGIRRRAARAPSLASRRPSATSSRGSGRPSQA